MINSQILSPMVSTVIRRNTSKKLSLSPSRSRTNQGSTTGTEQLNRRLTSRKSSGFMPITPSLSKNRQQLVNWLERKLLFKYYILNVDSDSDSQKSESFFSHRNSDAGLNDTPQKSKAFTLSRSTRKGQKTTHTIYGTSRECVQTFRTPVIGKPYFVISIKRHASKTSESARKAARIKRVPKYQISSKKIQPQHQLFILPGNDQLKAQQPVAAQQSPPKKGIETFSRQKSRGSPRFFKHRKELTRVFLNPEKKRSETVSRMRISGSEVFQARRKRLG